MNYIGKHCNRLRSIKLEVFIEWSLFLIFMITLLQINTYNNLLFHTLIELFINFIFLSVFVFAFNTYSINKNNFIIILGIGCFFIAILGITHILTYPGMPFLSKTEGLNITTQLRITSRYMAVFTFLIAIIFMLKPNKKVNLYILFIIYFCITALLLLSILKLRIFPGCYIINLGLTPFKIISEYILCAAFLSIAYIFFIFGKYKDRYLFFCLETFLILSGLCEIFLTTYKSVCERTNIIGHIVTIIAAYFLYKGVVETGLRRPYNLINNNLDAADNKAKLFEEIITQNEQCYNMLINNCDNSIFVVSDNKFVFANKKLAELVGAENTDEIIGSSIDRIIIDEIRNEVYEQITDALHNKKSNPFTESKLLRFDGKIIDIEVANCFCTYKGKPSIVVMFRDITLKKQIQTLKSDALENKKLIDKTTEVNKMMTEFFSNISHELKTPLNVILGAVQILSLNADDTYNSHNELGINKYLKTIKQNCYRLVRLVNNLIDISKFDSGYFKVDLKNYNVVSVIEDITLSVADYANNRGIELLFDTDTEENNMAIDLDKIERILLNLLSNSIKFTNEGGQILVTLLDRGNNILLSIKDNGVGIPNDKLDVIFERFGQVDKTLSRNREGSGIGLSLVKSIVDMHGGNIKVLSEFGKGSEFLIELPARLVEEEHTYDGRLYESKVEKISIEFSDIYSY